MQLECFNQATRPPLSLSNELPPGFRRVGKQAGVFGKTNPIACFEDAPGEHDILTHRVWPAAQFTQHSGVVHGKCALGDERTVVDLLIEHGAKRVMAATTHGLFAGDAIEAIQASPIEEVIVTDTVPVTAAAQAGKITVLSVAPLLGEAIRRNYFHLSVSKLFD